jgi:5-hydroxyisourate hydrolase-like protein (transthyretin family)
MWKNKALSRAVGIPALSVALTLGATAQQPAQPPANFHVSGTLLDATDGEPVASARVSLASVYKREDRTTVVTTKNGGFSFAGLAAGSYTLTAQARGYLSQAFNQHEQSWSYVVVGTNRDTSNLVFRLTRASTISGVVVDEAGEPVRDAQISLYLDQAFAGVEQTRLHGQSGTDDQGAFRFNNLVAGRYFIAVSARPWYAQSRLIAPGAGPIDPGTAALDVAYPVTFNGGATDVGSAVPLAVAPGERATVEIALQPVHAVQIPLNSEGSGYPSLQVRGPGGAPIDIGTQVRTYGSSRTDVIGIAPGRYTMSFNYRTGVSEDRPAGNEVEINNNGEVNKIPSVAFVPVTAKLQLEGTLPAQLSLQLFNKKTRETIRQVAGEGGEIVFKAGVQPGIYEISIGNAAGLYLKNVSAEGARVTGRTLEIRPGTPVKLTVNAARGQGQITGTALRDDKPFVGAMILLVPADPAHNQVLHRRAQSNSDGSFVLVNVVPGAYTLLAIEKGWDLPWLEPAVLKNYMSRGVSIQVQLNGKHTIEVPVQ